jgi:copper(I)-binding protein
VQAWSVRNGECGRDEVKPITIWSATLCALLNIATVGVAQSGSEVQASDAWIRWLPANIPSGAYLTLTNSGTVPQTLVGATSPDFAEVSFHQTRTVNGVSEMTALSALTVRPQGRLQFAPGGYHLMLMQPLRALHPGDHVPITLRFADGRALQASFQVRSANASTGEAETPPAMHDMPGMPR